VQAFRWVRTAHELFADQEGIESRPAQFFDVFGGMDSRLAYGDAIVWNRIDQGQRCFQPDVKGG
jgi:hypothetical protein